MVAIDEKHGMSPVHVSEYADSEWMWMFLRAASLLSELNAFEASTKS